jgi:hypothetical protein
MSSDRAGTTECLRRVSPRHQRNSYQRQTAEIFTIQIEFAGLWCRERCKLGAKCSNFQRTSRRISDFEDWVADDPVRCEPFSAVNSLLNRERTGNFSSLMTSLGKSLTKNTEVAGT